MSIRLIVIDDNVWIRDALRFAFSDTEVDLVAEAASGEEGVQMVLEQEVDAVLLDLRMPDIDGLQIIDKIKSKKRDLPIVIYTAHEPQEVRSQCESIGAETVLQKGKDEGKLVAAVCDAVAKTI